MPMRKWERSNSPCAEKSPTNRSLRSAPAANSLAALQSSPSSAGTFSCSRHAVTSFTTAFSGVTWGCLPGEPGSFTHTVPQLSRCSNPSSGTLSAAKTGSGAKSSAAMKSP